MARVWITGVSEGLQLKASLWLRTAADRRTAQRDLLLAIGERLHESPEPPEPTPA